MGETLIEGPTGGALVAILPDFPTAVLVTAPTVHQAESCVEISFALLGVRARRSPRLQAPLRLRSQQEHVRPRRANVELIAHASWNEEHIGRPGSRGANA